MLRPYKSPKLGATRAQRKIMAPFKPAKTGYSAKIYTPQLGFNLGMDGRGGLSGPIDTFSGDPMMTFSGDPIVTFR